MQFHPCGGTEITADFSRLYHWDIKFLIITELKDHHLTQFAVGILHFYTAVNGNTVIHVNDMVALIKISKRKFATVNCGSFKFNRDILFFRRILTDDQTESR